MNVYRKLISGAFAATVLAVLIPTAQARGLQESMKITFSGPAEDSARVSKLLSEAKGQALQLSEDTSEMESFAHVDVSWRAHVDAVDRIKEDVNLMGRQLAKLDEARNTAAPWQKTAIDRITPLLKELASNTNAVIEDLNKNPSLLSTDKYKAYLEANADEAAHLSSLIAHFVDYGKTKLRLERLTSRLELTPGGN